MIRLIQAAFIDMENMFDLLDEKVEVSYLWFTTLIEPSIVVWRGNHLRSNLLYQ